MKLMIASDIHGSAFYCRAMIEAFEREEADRLLLLGDILYHGPRNDFPVELAAEESDRDVESDEEESALAVRGNCDTEVDPDGIWNFRFGRVLSVGSGWTDDLCNTRTYMESDETADAEIRRYFIERAYTCAGK